MKSIIITSLLIMAGTQISAQISVSGRYLSNNFSVVSDLTGEDLSSTESGYEVGLGYWFRLKNKRMEFTPEISYGDIGGGQFALTTLALNWNTLIYPLDFHSDCDACPTFSKEGGLIKKGFYWLVSPGVILISDDFDDTDSNLTYRIGIGAGLDIGVTNLLTVSPFGMYNFLGSGTPVIEDSTNISQIHLGARLTFRFDKDRW